MAALGAGASCREFSCKLFGAETSWFEPVRENIKARALIIKDVVFQRPELVLLPIAKHGSTFISPDRVLALTTELCTFLSVLFFFLGAFVSY